MVRGRSSDLIISIDPSLLRLVKGLYTAKSIWERLKYEFASTEPVKKTTLLKRVATYKMRLRCVGVDIHEELLSMLLLNGLPSCFDLFRCTMESHDNLPKPEILREKILEKKYAQNRRKAGVDNEAMYIPRNAHQHNSKFGRNDFHKSSAKVKTTFHEKYVQDQALGAMDI